MQETNYDALGNITGKLGVDTYSYGQGANAGPYAVTTTVLGAQITNYAYDPNG